MYKFISDPDSLKRYPIQSMTGQKIINMYINKLNGGSSPPVTPRRLNSMFDDASSPQSPQSGGRFASMR